MCVWLLREDVSSGEKLTACQTPLSVFGPRSPWQQRKHAYFFFNFKKLFENVLKHTLGRRVVCASAVVRPVRHVQARR